MRYSEKSKRDAVRMVIEGRARTDVAREYGVSGSTVNSWVVNLLPSMYTTGDLEFIENPDNSPELLNEGLAEVVKEFLLYGPHPLSTEDDSDDIWADDDLMNLKLTNGDVIDCSELASEVLDSLKRYLSGKPMLQSFPVEKVQQ